MAQQTSVEIRTLTGSSLAVGSSGPRTVTIDRSKESGGLGLGFNGGELLLLAIGGCYSNDLYREAAKQGIKIHDVQIQVQADWGGDPVRAQNVPFSAAVNADPGEKEIIDLIRHTDSVAEIPNSLRMRTEVKLIQPKAIASGRQ
ncbi:MAG: oxidoreductase [Acidobacteriaceae bacterium]|jgi:putative redox protein|nr:oxidoreductase [Acidobacteriaceae bacterium]